jgi:hypothetical protein
MELKDFAGVRDFLSYYHVTLVLGDEQRYAGRVNHLQVLDLPEELIQEGISHRVRFYDGANRRELLGTVRLETGKGGDGDGVVLTLDMGAGKSYRFRKHGSQEAS